MPPLRLRHPAAPGNGDPVARLCSAAVHGTGRKARHAKAAGLFEGVRRRHHPAETLRVPPDHPSGRMRPGSAGLIRRGKPRRPRFTNQRPCRTAPRRETRLGVRNRAQRLHAGAAPGRRPRAASWPPAGEPRRQARGTPAAAQSRGYAPCAAPVAEECGRFAPAPPNPGERGTRRPGPSRNASHKISIMRRPASSKVGLPPPPHNRFLCEVRTTGPRVRSRPGGTVPLRRAPCSPPGRRLRGPRFALPAALRAGSVGGQGRAPPRVARATGASPSSVWPRRSCLRRPARP